MELEILFYLMFILLEIQIIFLLMIISYETSIKNNLLKITIIKE
jgi:hypothetical protein